MGPCPERTSYCSIRRVSVRADIVAAQEARLCGELRLEIPLQHEVVLERIVQHEAVLVAVLGDVAHAEHGSSCGWTGS